MRKGAFVQTPKKSHRGKVEVQSNEIRPTGAGRVVRWVYEPSRRRIFNSQMIKKEYWGQRSSSNTKYKMQGAAGFRMICCAHLSQAWAAGGA